jgi:hypothetical protein
MPGGKESHHRALKLDDREHWRHLGPSSVRDAGSGTADTGVASVLMLSRANAGTDDENVIWTLSNGIVLAIPANPPVKVGSGIPL